MTQTTKQITNCLVDYVKLLDANISINTETLNKLIPFTQTLADSIFKVKDTTLNTVNMVKGSLSVIGDRFDLIIGIQDSMLNLIITFSNMAMFSIWIDALHTISFIVLAIYTIRLGRKLKEKENDIT